MSEIAISFDKPVSEGGMTTISARVGGVSEQPRQLWYRIEAEHAPDALATAHAFTVSLINTAMGLNRDLRIDGPLTHGLMLNLEEYQAAWSRWMPDRFRHVAIRPSEVMNDEAFRPERGFLLPFSGGLDSMHAAWALHRQGRLGALASIHGLDIHVGEAERWAPTLERLRDCARSLGVPLYAVQTNWEAFARDLPGYLGYFLPVVAGSLLLAGNYGAVASPSSYPYDHLTFPLETNPITDPLLGRPALPVLHCGAAAHRIDKVAAIASWPQALEHLRPCDAPLTDGRACGRCRKCIQTALSFLGRGFPVPPALGGREPSIEDIENFQMTPYARLGLRDAVDSARKRGLQGAWIGAAERRLANIELPLPTHGDTAEWRRRLDYVLGGTDRPAPMRLLRRVLRTLRGATGPRELPPLSNPIPAPVSGPLSGPASNQHLSHAAGIPRAAFARTARGHRIYIEPADRRGAALVESAGNLKPAALAMWKQLVDARDWTVIVDVGANYGEMLVNLDVPDSARVIAVEPNPHVGWYLERTLREAGLRVEIVRKAVSERAGAVDIILDRTWSGMSGILIDSADTAGHHLEPIRVDAITLYDLLGAGANRHEMHVLAKIDVEGHEANVLRGLAGFERDFGSFAALIEITQLPQEDIAWVLERYTIELFDLGERTLTQVAVERPHELSSLLASGRYYPHDIVVRPR